MLRRSHSAQSYSAAGRVGCFLEGEPCNGLHIIARGQGSPLKTSVNGREQVLSVNVAGESVAEIPVFDGGSLPCFCGSPRRTEIVFISRRDFNAYCLEHPEVPLKVLTVVGARPAKPRGIIEESVVHHHSPTLISTLLKLAQSEAGRRAAWHRSFQLPASHRTATSLEQCAN